MWLSWTVSCPGGLGDVARYSAATDTLLSWISNVPVRVGNALIVLYVCVPGGRESTRRSAATGSRPGHLC